MPKHLYPKIAGFRKLKEKKKKGNLNIFILSNSEEAEP